MDTTPTTNQAAADADKLIKLVEGILVPIAENAIVAAVPALGLPIVKQIVDVITQALSDDLTQLAETGVTFGIIDNQVSNEEDNITSATAALEAAQTSGDSNAIAKANAEEDAAAQALINSDGSATPQ